jgi:2-hydroxychromene-2-carboxylate isomerase
VTDDALERVAASAGLDADSLRERSSEAWVDVELEQSAALAQSAGVQGTPAFQVGRTGKRLELVELRSLEPSGITPAIDALLE